MPKFSLQAVYFMDEKFFEDVYGPEQRAQIEDQVKIIEMVTPEGYRASNQRWPGVEVILGGWGLASIDAAFLDRFPELKAIFYAAGSIRLFATSEMWQRGIRVTSATSANAVPVTEFALSQILFAAKSGWRYERLVRKLGAFPPPRHFRPPGAYRSTVGLLSLGMIGRMVAKRLREFDFRLIAYDPFVSSEDAVALGVELATLEEVFMRGDVVSCHIPHLPETTRLLNEQHFSSMKKGATFLNTGRGQVVAEDEMIAVLQRRPDLTAILDVTFPEPPMSGSPLYTLPNVVLTPHIAGSVGNECRRMGQLAADELKRYLGGNSLHYEIDEPSSAMLA